MKEMCIGIPQKIIKLKKNVATVETKKRPKDIDVSLISDVKVGDWILAHDQIGVNKIEPEEAEKILKITKGGEKECQHQEQ